MSLEMIERLRFTGQSKPFSEVLEKLNQRHSFSSASDVTEEVKTIFVDGDLAQELKGIFGSMQGKNAEWAEGRLKALREEFKDWSLDGILVNQEGRVVASWSTFQTYLANKELALTRKELVKLMRENNQFFFPLTARRDSTLFFFREHEAKIRETIAQTVGNDFEMTDYPINPRVAPQMSDMVRMCRLVRNRVGSGKFRSAEIVLGKLGFWGNTRFNIGGMGLGFLARVYMRGLANDPQRVISPLSKGRVIAEGGIPMDEKHDVEVIRLPQISGEADFIASSLLAGSEKLRPGVPFVLRYNAYKPWLDEYPHHGEKPTK